MPETDTTELGKLLRNAGIAPETTAAVMEIDWLMQAWRRRAMKRELGHRALVELKVGLDLSQFDVLAAIEGTAMDPEGSDSGEVMVSTVAERLNIDPSRASRLVSEMVDQGYARRAVSQADARRSILELTPAGLAVVEAVRAYKFLIMGDFLSGWDAGELATFVPLLKRFGRWMDGIGPATEKHAEEIEALSRQLASKAASDELA